MNIRRNKLAFAIAQVLAGAGFAALATNNVAAQEAAAEEIDEIIVSAQLRTQSLQDVPIAIQVVDQKLIEDIAAEDMSDLNGYVPGLVISGDSPTQPRYQIRGIQTGDFGVGTDPAVGVYVDGIYAARSGASMTAFNDIERIEVLKGPQGTLFGRNSAAGAIAIVTKQPTDEFDAMARVRFGEFNKQYFEGMLNAPLGDKVALRVNGVFNKSDGWMEDAATGEDLAPEENWAGRVALRWNLSEKTHATLSWDHDDLDQLARPAIGLVGNQVPVPFPSDPANYVDPRDADIFNDVVGNEESRKLDQVNLFIDHSFGSVNFRSSTSWRQFETVNLEDEDGTNQISVYFDTGNFEDNESIYQEFKLSGQNERIDWVAGVSYYKEDADQVSDTHTFTDAVDTLGTNLGIWDLLGLPFPLYGGTTAVLQGAGVPANMLGLPWREAMYNHGDFEAYAAYGDMILHVSDKTNLTLGLRFTQDNKEFTWTNGPHETPELDAMVEALDQAGAFDPFGFPVPPQVLYRFQDFVFPVDTPPEGVTQDHTWTDVSPRLVLDHKVNDNFMWFGSLAKGYKAGGFNSVEVASQFENEEVWNVESGIKSSFPQAGLTLNASAFYYVYDNKQAITLVDIDSSGIPEYLVDTSDEQAWGVEADAQWQATDHFTLYANFAFIDATYKDKMTQDVVPVDLSGEPTGEPYFSAALGASYNWVLGNSGNLELSGRFAYRGEGRCNENSETQGSCASLTPFEVGGDTQRLDMRLGWTSANEKFGIAGFVTNALDDQYVTGINNITNTTFGTAFGSISEPRMWGVEATVRF
jgi:iron complex outermembrane receptor protein